jgi:hypothetical protein
MVLPKGIEPSTLPLPKLFSSAKSAQILKAQCLIRAVSAGCSRGFSGYRKKNENGRRSRFGLDLSGGPSG